LSGAADIFVLSDPSNNQVLRHVALVFLRRPDQHLVVRGVRPPENLRRPGARSARLPAAPPAPHAVPAPPPPPAAAPPRAAFPVRCSVVKSPRKRSATVSASAFRSLYSRMTIASSCTRN